MNENTTTLENPKVIKIHNEAPVGVTVDQMREEIDFLDRSLFKIALAKYLDDLESRPWKELKNDPLYNLNIHYPEGKV